MPAHAFVGSCALGPAEAEALGLAGVEEAGTLAALDAAGASLVRELKETA